MGDCPYPISQLHHYPDGRIDWGRGWNWKPCGRDRSPVGQRHGGGLTCGLHRSTAEDSYDQLLVEQLASGAGTGPIRFKETEIY